VKIDTVPVFFNFSKTLIILEKIKWDLFHFARKNKLRAIVEGTNMKLFHYFLYKV
jgi:hypothetical protein